METEGASMYIGERDAAAVEVAGTGTDDEHVAFARSALSGTLSTPYKSTSSPPPRWMVVVEGRGATGEHGREPSQI